MSASASLSVADFIRAARDLYAANPSHAPGNQTPRCGTHCVVSALFAVGCSRLQPLSCDEGAVARIARIVHAHVRACCGGRDAVAFNASHSTAQVVAMFDRAAARAEGTP